MSDGDTAIVISLPRVNTWRRLVLGLFFLSGISGLLYEVAWTRLLHLLFGDTVLAVSTVLSSFMAGAGIGVSAVLFPLALQALTPLYVWMHLSLSSSFWLFSVVRFVLAFALLCVP